jgi:ABC-type multidrug transport system fused ATPase/permease subunit
MLGCPHELESRGAWGLLIVISATAGAAAVSESQFPPRTVADLIAICGPAQDDPLMTPAVNFCHGCAEGAADVEEGAARGNGARRPVMTELAAIANRSVLVFAVLLFVAQMLAHEAGYWLGSRRKAHGGETQAEGVGVVVGGMLGLLAFVLALTLSFANSRFSERVQGTLAEANAIGTAWLRAEAISHVRGPEMAKLLEEYARLRRDYVSEGQDQAAIDELNQRTNALQTKIWGHMAAILREQPNVVSTSLMSALNDAFDEATAERFAYNLRLPAPIFWLLIGMTLLGTGALGFQLGLTGRKIHLLVAFLSIMWTVVIVDILDLASPRIGAFRASSAVYDWTLQGFKGGLQIPPAPLPK